MTDALVASGTGGLLLVEDDGVTVLDPAPTTGIAVSPSGELLARLLYDPDGADLPGEVVLYDRDGLLAYRRVDELREAHGALWDGDELLVVSTKRNAVLRLSETGDLLRRWQAPGAEARDSWHLNNLARDGGRLVVSAFGRFPSHRAWAEPGARERSGVVFDLETGDDVLRGLTCPHDPTPLEDGWLVCDSAAGALLRLDGAGETLQRADLGGWTRGVAVGERHVHVAVSASRLQRRHGEAELVTLDRPTLAVVGRRALPCREVFTLAWLPEALVDGLRARPRSPTVAAAPMEVAQGGPAPLREEDCSVALEVTEPPARLAVATPLELPFRMTNLGPETLAGTGRTPVHVGARWLHGDSGATEEESRATLEAPLAPGDTAAGTLELWAPVRPGSYVLKVSAVQEHVRWFDDLDPANGWCGRVKVHAPGGRRGLRRRLRP